MTLNIAMATGILDFTWMSYSGPNMLTGSLPEETRPKSSHLVRLDIN